MSLRESADHRQDYLWLLMMLGGASVCFYVLAYAWAGLYYVTVVEAAFMIQVVAILTWMRWGRAPLRAVVLLEIAGVMAVITANTVLMGGLIPSGGFAVWTYLCPLAAMLFLDGVLRVVVLVGSLLFLAALVALDPWMVPIDVLDERLRGAFLVLNIVISAAVGLGTILFFHTRLERERRAVKESEDRYRATLDRVPSAVSLKDPSGRYLMVNRGFEDIFRRRAEVVRGMTDAQLFPADVEALGRQERSAWNEPPVGEHPERITVDGEARDLLSTRVLLRDLRGEPILCWIATDVTLRNRLQEDVLTARKLEALGTLAGGIAHDFNNLLMAMQGNIALARRDAPAHPADARLEAAERALGRASDLTFQILTFARGGAPVRTPTSIGEVLRDSASFVLHGTSVNAVMAVPDDLPAVEADAGQISRLVQNLVLNAVQAMPGGGALTLRADAVTADDRFAGLQPGRRYLRFEVADQGHGIPEDALDRIFDPYFSLRPGGSGLGLAACHSIVRQHEGLIRVASRPGKGSTFTVWLPASDQPVPAPVPAVARATRPGRVLVMDDEPSVRMVLRDMLQALGYDVDLSEEGGQAVRLCREACVGGVAYDAVVLDLTVRGGMGGAEAARNILQDDPGAVLVAASGYAEDPVLSSPGAHGFRAALRKPFSMEQLDRMMGEVTGRKGPAGPARVPAG